MKITLTDGKTQRSYEGDLGVAGIITLDKTGHLTARVETLPNPRNSFELLVIAVECLHKIVAMNDQTPAHNAAKAALQVIDDMDPTKHCPFCGRKPRKDGHYKISEDGVVEACERCLKKLEEQTDKK